MAFLVGLELAVSPAHGGHVADADQGFNMGPAFLADKFINRHLVKLECDQADPFGLASFGGHFRLGGDEGSILAASDVGRF